MAGKRLTCSLLAGIGLALATSAAGCDEEEAERGPRIVWWATRPHADRGPCTGCHTRTDGRGMPLPSITSASRMPHMERGVCSNCHPILVDGRRVIIDGPVIPAAQTRALPAQGPDLQRGATSAASPTQSSF